MEDDAASLYHACIVHRQGQFVLSDMGSTNGTYVNGVRVGELELHDHDDIRIGGTVLLFEILHGG